MKPRLVAMVLCVASLLLGSCLSGSLADTDPVKTKSIAAFKNGIGFFVREGEVPLSDGWGQSDIVPPAALGTFWVGSSKPGITVERLISTQEETTRLVPAVSVQEMLSSNIGKHVKITSGGTIIQGTLLAVPEDRRPDPNRPTYPIVTSVLPPRCSRYGAGRDRVRSRLFQEEFHYASRICG